MMVTRVVHVINDLATGGAEMMLYKLLSRTDRNQFEPAVISLLGKENPIGARIESLGIRVFAINVEQRRPSCLSLLRLRRLMAELEPDVIQGWMYHGNLASCLTLRFTRRVPVLWNIRHSLHDLSHEKRITRQVIRLGSVLSRIPARIIFNSRVSAVQHAQLGYATRRTTVISNGFDCEQYSPSKTLRRRVRQVLGVADSSILIGLIARYHPMKDHTTFFQAAGILARQYRDVQFLLAGPGVTADNEEIKQLVRRHELRDRTCLLGERDDISELTTALDIACSASYYGEAFSNAIGEAMACGVPCIATDVGDSKWIIGDTGRVVPPRDAGAFAEAGKALIAAGREERLRLGLNARKRILNDFSLDKVVQVYETLYEQTHRRYMRI